MLKNNTHWKIEDLKIQLDISTYCNAKCPQCHRTTPETLKKVDWLPLIHWTMEDFTKAFSEDDLKRIGEIHFSPTWGDPVMNPHLYDMVKHCFNVNRSIKIRVSTNGSIRNEEWWWKFGSLAKRKFEELSVIFAVDGLNQEMHERYRVNTNLKKVLNNMKAFSEAFYAEAWSQTVIFKHNEDYLEEIKQMCIDHGSKRHIELFSNRFEKEMIHHYKDNFLEKSTKDVNFIPNKKIEKVFCQWKNLNEVNINYDGSVHPCCYFGNSHGRKGKAFFENEIIKKYENDKNELNVFSNSLEEILLHKWFNSDLKNSIKQSPINQCRRHCGI